MDVGSSQRVTDAFVGIEVGVHELPLSCRRQLCEHLRGRIRERAADADHRLSTLRGIDEDADLGLEGLNHWLEGQLVGRREAVVGFVGCGVDRHVSRFDSLKPGRLRSL